jgi:hypothetical protein
MRVVVPYLKFATKTIEVGRLTKKTPKNAKWLVWLSGAIAVLAVAGLVWHNLSSPSNGQVALTTEDASPTTKLPEYTSLTTNYYTVNYSGRYSQQATDIPPAGILDQKILAYQLGGGAGQSQVEIDIKAAPDGGITQESNYISWIQHASQYQISNKLYKGEIVDLAKKTTGSPEQDALWLHNGFVMVIKITSPDRSQDISTELKDMLASVQWRQ